MTEENCTTVGRDQLTWDWNNEHVIQVGEFTLVKPAGAHNNIQVTGSPDKITIFSNGGTQDRSGQEFLVGDYGSDIQWVELCWTETNTPPVVVPEEPPALNDPVFQWVTGGPEIDCEGMTVTVVSHEEAAGWYWGNDGEQHLGGFHPTETEPETTVRPATAEECPAPPLDEEEETIPEEEGTPETPEEDFEWGEDVQVDCEQGTITFSFWQQREGFEKEEFSDTYPAFNEELAEAGCEVEKPDQQVQTVATVSQKSEPEKLAVTGGGLEWTALILGAVFVAAGLALYLRKPKR